MTNERAKPGREYLTKEEVDRLLIASKARARNPARDYAMLLLMFRHGLRVSELCALKLPDVSTKEIHVNREKGSDSGVHELLDGEARAVKAWLAERRRMEPPRQCEALFISERREGIGRKAVWAMLKEVAKAAGLEHLSIHPHMLRHSTGYAMVNSGNDIRIIQEYLGHKAISSTVRYTKLNKNRFKGIKGLV